MTIVPTVLKRGWCDIFGFWLQPEIDWKDVLKSDTWCWFRIWYSFMQTIYRHFLIKNMHFCCNLCTHCYVVGNHDRSTNSSINWFIPAYRLIDRHHRTCVICLCRYGAYESRVQSNRLHLISIGHPQYSPYTCALVPTEIIIIGFL